MKLSKIILFIAIALVPMAFACTSDNSDSFADGRHSHGNPGGPGQDRADSVPGQSDGPGNPSDRHGEEPPMMQIPDDAQDFEGTFVLLGGMTPTLTLDDGTVYFLIFRFPISSDDMPDDGTFLHVKAVPEKDHPDRLEVYMADIDGEPLKIQMPEMDRPPSGNGGKPPERPRS